MQGLFFTFFISIEGNQKIPILSAIILIAIISHPSTGRGLRKDGIGLNQEKEQYQELKKMPISWKVEILL